MKKTMRRVAFWGTVALVAVSADVALRLAPRYLPSPGLARLSQIGAQ